MIVFALAFVGASAHAASPPAASDDRGANVERVEREASGTASTATLAFPSAEGYGRFARGGRGGAVIIVDTVEDVIDEDDGMTSLREALQEAEGPRTIVFEVGGTFRTGETLVMSGEEDSYVTLACQSAPAPGVLIRGNGIRIRGGTHDVIMRHCRIRNEDPGGEEAESSRALAVVGTNDAATAMIFDHLSLGWATDENFTVFIGPDAPADTTNVTLSRSLVAEGDADSDHPESGQLPDRYLHAMGPSCNSSSSERRILGCSIIGNLMAHDARRSPLMWGVGGEVLENVVYNWHETALHVGPHLPGRVDIVAIGNLFKAGPTSKEGNAPIVLLEEEPPRTNALVRDNRMIEVGERRAHPLPEARIGEVGVEPNAARPFDLDCVGATRPLRDAEDARIIREYLAGTGTVGIGSDQERPPPDTRVTRRDSDFDTDRDGMADVWERAHGLDPEDPADGHADPDGDGHDHLETYLDELARC